MCITWLYNSPDVSNYPWKWPRRKTCIFSLAARCCSWSLAVAVAQLPFIPFGVIISAAVQKEQKIRIHQNIVNPIQCMSTWITTEKPSSFVCGGFGYRCKDMADSGGNLSIKAIKLWHSFGRVKSSVEPAGEPTCKNEGSLFQYSSGNKILVWRPRDHSRSV